MTDELSMMSEQHFVRRNGEDRGFVTRRIAGETIIVPVAGRIGDLDAIYTLNEVASRIWQLLDAPIPMSRIVQTISAEYDVVPESAAHDVQAFLSTLEASGLVRSTP